MKRLVATAACLLVGLLSSSASLGAPTFTYQFVVDSVVCMPLNLPCHEPQVAKDLSSIRITFSEEAWNRGSAEYRIEADSDEVVNTGVLAFNGGGDAGPHFVVEPPNPFGVGYTIVSVALSDFLSGSMLWDTNFSTVAMQGGGTTWNGSLSTDSYGNNVYSFTGYWAFVPEPSTITLLGIGLVGLAFIRGRIPVRGGV